MVSQQLNCFKAIYQRHNLLIGISLLLLGTFTHTHTDFFRYLRSLHIGFNDNACVCVLNFGLYMREFNFFILHNSFSCWKCSDTLESGFTIFRSMAIFFALYLSLFLNAHSKCSFAWTFCGSISMKRYKCIGCITRFSVCFHWHTKMND